MYNRVLIAVDGSEQAKRAAKRGLQLARAFDATVHVLTVVERKRLRLTETAAERSRLRERGENALTSIEELATELDCPVETELVEGRPAVSIGEYADEWAADLIVVGRQGLTGVGRRLLGGVTEQLVHRSDAPILVVPDGDVDPSAGYERVLLPTDGSENAGSAISHVTAIGRHHGATIHVLNVVDMQAAGGAFSAGGLEPEFLDRLDDRGREAIDFVASAITTEAPEVTVETAVTRSPSYKGAAAGVRDYVEENDIDLIVMGSHGRSNLARQLIGSVASTVLRTVDVPVIVVRRPS